MDCSTLQTTYDFKCHMILKSIKSVWLYNLIINTCTTNPAWKESDVPYTKVGLGAQLCAQTGKLLQNVILMHTNFPKFSPSVHKLVHN